VSACAARAGRLEE